MLERQRQSQLYGEKGGARNAFFFADPPEGPQISRHSGEGGPFEREEMTKYVSDQALEIGVSLDMLPMLFLNKGLMAGMAM